MVNYNKEIHETRDSIDNKQLRRGLHLNLGLIIGILLILLFVWIIISGIRNGDATISQMLGSVICIFVLVWITKGCVPISESSYEKQIVSNVQNLQHDALQFKEAIEQSFNYQQKGNGTYSEEEVKVILSGMFNIRDTVGILEDSQKEIARMKVPDIYFNAHSELELATEYLVLAAKAISSFKATNNSEYLFKAEEHLSKSNKFMSNAGGKFKEVNGFDILK